VNFTLQGCQVVMLGLPHSHSRFSALRKLLSRAGATRYADLSYGGVTHVVSPMGVACSQKWLTAFLYDCDMCMA
jgi:hypothetical protein